MQCEFRRSKICVYKIFVVAKVGEKYLTKGKDVYYCLWI